MTRTPQEAIAQNKAAVRTWVDSVINRGDLGVADDLFSTELADDAKRWVIPFRAAFPDVQMEVVDLIGESDKVVGRFLCSGTQAGEWRGRPASGHRFEDVDEVYFFTFADGKIVHMWGLEDTADRLKQLGMSQ